jgi:anti-anti-sigma factor
MLKYTSPRVTTGDHHLFQIRGRGTVEIIEDTYEKIPILIIRGEVDHQCAPSMATAAERVLGEGVECLIFDLAECSYMDSGGVSVLLHLLVLLRERGWLAVVGAEPYLLRIFAITGITNDPAFHVFASRDVLAGAI